MTTAARSAAFLAVMCLGGAAACAAAPPRPEPSMPAASPSPAPSAIRSRSAAPSESPRPRPGLGAELEVHRLDPELTHPVLEFASDGASIVYSSGIADDTGPGAVPDVWRYVPGPSATPELVWRNPHRDHSVVKLDGDAGAIMFVDIPLTGEAAWDLWLIPQPGAEPILLDTHPGDAGVPSFVPSFSLSEGIVAWTAFDRGDAGPVSQLLVAEAPSWEPRVIAERDAMEAELWLPSLYGRRLVYTEVRYADDRSRDERSVQYLALDGADPPRRLDRSGRATMPLLVGETVYWKEADPGFNMFNWGRMFRHELATGTTTPVSIWPQEYVNYPSAGTRFLAWRGADAFTFSVYDMVRERARLIERFPDVSQVNVLRPHIRGELLAWMYVDTSGAKEYSELRWARMPTKADP